MLVLAGYRPIAAAAAEVVHRRRTRLGTDLSSCFVAAAVLVLEAGPGSGQGWRTVAGAGPEKATAAAGIDEFAEQFAVDGDADDWAEAGCSDWDCR